MKSKMILKIVLSLIVFAGVILIAGRIYLSIQFHKEVRQLFSLSRNISGKTFHNSQLVGLPEPVQRYFTHVLKDGQPYISYARIRHDGQFKTGLDKDWIDIRGEQYATTERPGFIWKGTTRAFTARDMYIAGEGRLVVSLFSLFTIANAKGEQYNQGELLRWLGESILYPTNLLPDDRLQWTAIDAQSAKLSFNYNGLSLAFIMTFNDKAELIQMETTRYMDKTTQATWIIKCREYKSINNILVPTALEVFWRLAKGDFSYARFNIQEIEYNKPERF